jgi:Flp pilus assembly secretin CpaC
MRISRKRSTCSHRRRRAAICAVDRDQRADHQGHAGARRGSGTDHPAIDKARPEVVIDVELLEVNRTKLLEYGLQIAAPVRPGSTVGRHQPRQVDARKPDESDAVRHHPDEPAGALLPLLKSDANTRTLANPQLRTLEGIAAQARFGEQVPVPVTTFAPIATGGVQQQPITSFQYQNIGVNIDITPRTHHDDDVSLALKVWSRACREPDSAGCRRSVTVKSPPPSVCAMARRICSPA